MRLPKRTTSDNALTAVQDSSKTIFLRSDNIPIAAFSETIDHEVGMFLSGGSRLIYFFLRPTLLGIQHAFLPKRNHFTDISNRIRGQIIR